MPRPSRVRLQHLSARGGAEVVDDEARLEVERLGLDAEVPADVDCEAAEARVGGDAFAGGVGDLVGVQRDGVDAVVPMSQLPPGALTV